MNSVAMIVVALIGAGGPVMWLLTRFDKRNTDQHNANMEVLKDIREDVKSIDSRLDKHIDWHVHRD